MTIEKPRRLSNDRQTDYNNIGRRRKKSCLPQPGNTNVCTECHARGVPCREQQASAAPKRLPANSKRDFQQRVTELEKALQSVVTRLDGTTDTREDASRTLDQLRADLVPSTSTASSSVASPDDRLENAPALSLFNNSILSHSHEDENTNVYGSGAGAILEADNIQSLKLGERCRTLLALFPPQDELNKILDRPQSLWHSSQTIYSQIFGPKSKVHISHFIAESKASGSIQKIAKALLWISISISGVLVESDFRNDSATSITRLPARCVNVIQDLVISDDHLVGTLDGVECLLMHSRYDINEGHIRRAWITTRRGISFAQLLGFHVRPKTSGPSENVTMRGWGVWQALYHVDRITSLLLGLPYGVSESHFVSPRSDGLIATAGDVDKYDLYLSTIVGHIIDRNQGPASSNTLPKTLEIEGELTDLAASMPSGWWLENAEAEDIESHMNKRLLPQFWHHVVRVLLHLPYMLKAATDRRYEYNKVAALESARTQISLYRAFRPIQGFGSLVCKVIDFQVFTAAMVLVLNLLGTSSSSPARDQEEAAMDEELITITHDLLHRASLETRTGVTTQAARALKFFCKARADRCPHGKTTAKIVIPYFGTVVFGAGKGLRNQAYLASCAAPKAPVQMPTPDTEPVHGSTPETSGSDLFPASIPPDLNFAGYEMQAPRPGDLEWNAFANVNLDLDQDWSWFWDNTSMT